MDEHDTIYKLLCAHDRMIQGLLIGFLPEQWVAALDLKNGSYVTEDLRGRHGDAVWRIRWGEDWLYVHLLLELQSSLDRFMAQLIMVYTALLHQDLIRRGGRSSSTFGKVAGRLGTDWLAQGVPHLAAPPATKMVPRRNLPRDARPVGGVRDDHQPVRGMEGASTSCGRRAR